MPNLKLTFRTSLLRVPGGKVAQEMKPLARSLLVNPGSLMLIAGNGSGSEIKYEMSFTGMENLPVEVIAHIIKFLSSLRDRKACSLVCRSWYEAYQDPLFRNFEVLHITSDDRFTALLQVKNENRKYYYMIIKEIEIAENTIKFWERFGPHVKALSIFSCDIREKTLISILKKCLQLESLSIQSCRELFMIGNLLEDQNEKLILKNTLKSLTSLNLSYNRYLSDAIFVKFTSVFENIKKLLIAGCQISFFSGLYKRYYPNGQVIPSESVFTFPVILDYIQKNSCQVQYLSFNDTFIDNVAICYLAQIKNLQLNSLHLRGCFQLSHGGIVSLTDNQKSLTELDVSLCPRITDGSLLAICSGLPNLISLSVQRCRAITDYGVSSLWQLEKLIYLNISECDLVEGGGIVEGICHKINPNFKELRLSYLGNMTDDVVVALSKCLPNLNVLDLGFCYNAVTDKSIQSVLENNRRLRTLILTMCEKLTDNGLTGLGVNVMPANKMVQKGLKLPLGSKAEIEIIREAKVKKKLQEISVQENLVFSGFSLKTLKGLQHLNISRCSGISDITLMYALELKELRNLDLSHCDRISEKGLEYLSKNNPSIESLNLDLCQGVDNGGVKHIVQNLKRLETLILGSCKINDSIAPFISRYGKGIVYLDIRNCSQISIAAINLMNKSLPHLQNFHFSAMKSEDVNIPVPPGPKRLW